MSEDTVKLLCLLGGLVFFIGLMRLAEKYRIKNSFEEAVIKMRKYKEASEKSREVED